MRTLNLKDYAVEVDVTDPATGKEKTVEMPVRVRSSLVAILFADQQLGLEEALARQDLAQRIRKAAGDSLLIEEADFNRLVVAVHQYRGYNQYTVLLAVRVEKETPAVEVKAV